MNNLFLTGKVGVGKSTILKNVLERINLSIGGYVTERFVQEHIRTYTVRSLYDGVEKHTIAKIDRRNCSKEIFIDSFDKGIISILDKSLKNRDLIVLDELGFMENDIDIFTSKIYELLDSEKVVFGVLKQYDCEFLNNIKARDDVIVVEVTEENRDSILDEILDIMKSFNIPLKKDSSFHWSRRRIDWYNEALEHPSSSYPHAFIKEIKKYTGDLDGKTILDIGAGTGAFAIPLMEEGAHVTAIDSSFNMIDSLVYRALKHNLNNINCIISPFEKSNPTKHNIAVSAFSSGTTKTLKGIEKMHNLVDEYSFIISSFESQKDNFKTNILYEMLDRPQSKRRVHRNNLCTTLGFLDTLGYKYDNKIIEYEFSQYFNSFDESLSFFMDRYNIVTSEEIEILEKFMNKFLIKKDNQYIFENIKKSYLITIKTKF